MGKFFYREDGFLADSDGNIKLRTMANKSDREINIT